MDIKTFARAAELSKKIDSYQTILQDLNDPHTKVKLSIFVSYGEDSETKKLPDAIENCLLEKLKTELLIGLDYFKREFDSL